MTDRPDYTAEVRRKTPAGASVHDNERTVAQPGNLANDLLWAISRALYEHSEQLDQTGYGRDRARRLTMFAEALHWGGARNE